MFRFFGPHDPRDPGPQFRIEDMDFAKFQRILRLALFGLALVLLWSGLNWAQSFYTDWLWFSSVGHESVLWKTMTTRLGLFLAGALIFLVLAVPNLYAAFRVSDRMFPQGGHNLPPQVYNTARNALLWLSCGATHGPGGGIAGRRTSRGMARCAPFSPSGSLRQPGSCF